MFFAREVWCIADVLSASPSSEQTVKYSKHKKCRKNFTKSFKYRERRAFTGFMKSFWKTNYSNWLPSVVIGERLGV